MKSLLSYSEFSSKYEGSGSKEHERKEEKKRRKEREGRRKEGRVEGTEGGKEGIFTLLHFQVFKLGTVT